MSITIYRDDDAKAIFIEDANGAQFLNSLHATVDNNLVSIEDTAKGFELVSDVDHTDLVDFNGVGYGVTATEACDALNVIFQTSGSTGEVPVITSNTTINLTEGDTLNYELTADYGVGYEWDSLPSGVVTVDGNIRKLIGGSSLSAGTYTPTVKAINYFGEDQETITINVANPPFSNSKSIQFQQNDSLTGDATLLQSILGRSGNGSGASDAWSISLYFKAGTSNNQSQTIFYYGGTDLNNSNSIRLGWNGNNSTRQQITLDYGSNNNKLRFISPANVVSNNGSWNHIMITYDGGTTGSSSGSLSSYYSRFKMFINGVEQTTTNTHNNFGNTTALTGSSWKLGRLANGSGYMRNSCKVDELALFNSDQSANISDIYNSGDPFDLSTLGTPPPYWCRMGDGDTFPTLQDVIGSADLTMQNMTVADIVNDVP